ncbi:DUF262 domain-containing protein [Aliivibrio sp. S4TY2]|uniref:DUF262 domain-containing protein n=1 Tax=unclassified Aliivibrio TaxID=2645654 RepID=UPI0023795D9A|nr:MULTISPECIES: DUF262 domain-containing protein [unclassified Aliivibrio]MDD9156865.1 DUF262 domain-containing protein [Aliivibrio sp. S4TY2]MDD9160921.1 DUF262 domain-containing protein [Aliivibrio sp. S4TY1]MDD9164951.1 DUF262 domain-containing protein [Aliivibrio sp. S4MY2]MDD9168774.1 DUF262 domain-containing protein [Aliivibrio sp. S4MY4]MDD9185303.1 DUF262 domain-containing protein [Aliivibrio sp. S4MY3]
MSKSDLMPIQENNEDIEIADAIESCCDKSYDMAPDTSIRIAKEQFSIFEIVRHIEGKRINLSPDFQRYNVWSDFQRSELIESVLMGIPIPMLYLFENEKGEKQVIDGKQRLTAIYDFMKDSFPLSKLRLLTEYNGFAFSKLPSILQARLEDCQLHTYIVQPPTPDVIKFYIFDRINRGGTQLNQQEMRHALHQGLSTKLLYDIANDERFAYFNIAKTDSSRMQKEYMALRCVTFHLCAFGYVNCNEALQTNDINELHSMTMKFLNGCDESFVEQLYIHTVWCLYYSIIVLGEDAFRYSGSNNRTIISLFEMIPFILGNYFTKEKIDLGNRSKDLVHSIINKYKDYIREDKSLSLDYKTISSLNNRIHLAKEIIEEIRIAK